MSKLSTGHDTVVSVAPWRIVTALLAAVLICFALYQFNSTSWLMRLQRNRAYSREASALIEQDPRFRSVRIIPSSSLEIVVSGQVEEESALLALKSLIDESHPPSEVVYAVGVDEVDHGGSAVHASSRSSAEPNHP